MRMLVFATVGFSSLFSPPPCQTSNPDFVREDGSATSDGETSATGDESSMSGQSATSGLSETSDGSEAGDHETTAGTVADTSGTSEETSTETAETSTDDGETCPDPGHEDCFGTCVDLTSNNDHCGMCGRKCHPVMETCMDSTCVRN